jgi:hypothetical protein
MPGLSFGVGGIHWVVPKTRCSLKYPTYTNRGLFPTTPEIISLGNSPLDCYILVTVLAIHWAIAQWIGEVEKLYYRICTCILQWETWDV